MAYGVDHNVGIAGHGRVIDLDNVCVFDHRVDLHLAECIPLVLDAVACDPFDSVPLLVGRVLD